MKKSSSIRTLFVDIGGVLLTNGWDHEYCTQAAKTISLNPEEMAVRHHLLFETYDLGKLTIEEYLSQAHSLPHLPESEQQGRGHHEDNLLPGAECSPPTALETERHLAEMNYRGEALCA